MVPQQHAKALFFLGITTSLLLFSAPQKTNQSSIRNQEIAVIFDLNGVLVRNSGETKIVGVAQFIPYALMHGFSCKQRLKNSMYTFFESIESRTPGQALACDQDGTVLPQLMCEWMRGTQTPATILAKIQGEAKNRATGLEIDLISSISRMIFTPELFVQTQHIVDEMMDFVRELKKQGYKTYILSNFDSQSFRLLTQEYPELLTLFNGRVISGDVGLLKPETAIYEYMLDAHAIDRSKAFFIDDQIVNVQGAREAGIESALCTLKKGVLTSAPDTDNVRTQFYAWREHLNHAQAIA
jgi:HAD superfamily hydrolase (TIGR01549 family)